MPKRLDVILFILVVSHPVHNMKQEMYLAGSICTQYDPCKLRSKNGQCCGCSCDLECHTVGNCCYGDMGVVTDGKLYGGREYLTLNKELCMKPLLTGGRPRDWSKSYLFVKECAENYTGPETIWCETESLTIESLTPVYGKQTGLNYANVHCAACNFISRDDTLPWQPIIKCVQDFDVLSVTDDEISFLQKMQTSPDCALTWSHLEDGLVKDCVLDIDVIKTCDPEIMLSFPPKFTNVTDLCQDTPFLLYSSSHHSYKNPYCFLCNNENVFFTGVDCRPVTFSRYNFLVRFSVILDFGSLKSKSQAANRNRLDVCGGELEYNTRLNRCLNHTCPPSFVKRSGKCFPLIEIVNNVILDFHVKLIYTNESTFPSMEEVKATVYHLTKNHFAQSHTALFSIWYLKYRTLDSRTIEYRANFVWEVASDVDPYFEYSILQKHLKRWETDSLSIALDDNVSFHELNVDSSKYFRFNIDREYTGMRKLIIAMHNLQFCDAVLIAPDDYQLQNFSLLSGQGLFSASEYVIRPVSGNKYGFAHICRDVYEDRVQRFESNFSAHAGQVNLAISSHLVKVLTLVCTIISMVSLGMLILFYTLTKQAQTVPIISSLTLAGNLLVAQGLFQFGISLTEIHWLCATIGMAIHYFWLVYICWTTVCTFHLFYTFVMSEWSVGDCKHRIMLYYCLFCYTLPLVFVAINVVVSTTRSGNLGYGKSLCYISTLEMIGYTFALPLALFISTNFILFLVVLYKLHVINDRRMHYSQNAVGLKIYIKLSTLTGMAWLLGFLYVLTELQWVEHIFVVLNASHGLFLMLSLMCNQRNFTIIKQRFCKNR